MKIAIIGAGICGLYLAWKLAEKGEDVTVFEKKEKIGKDACSGLFSNRILEFIPQSKNLIQNKIEYCLIHFLKKTLKIKFSRKFFLISHFELDNLVVNLAKKSGVKIFLNHKITKEELIILENNFEKIIGCDGINSIVRRKLKEKEPKFYLGIQGFLKENNFSDFVETWPTKSGFIWKIPRGNEVEYGIIENLKEAKLLLEEFLRKNNLFLERINSAIISQGELIIPSNPKITLCGEASGLVKPWSGGGVIWGLTAVNILLKNFPNFLRYKKEIKKFFLPKIIFSKITKKILYFLGFKFPWLLPKKFKMESDFLI